MQTFKVGLLADLTGALSYMGLGFKNSAQFMLGRRRAKLQDANIDLVPLECDYAGDVSASPKLAAECISQGAIAIFGPCDSGAAYEVIRSGVASQCALISPIATASILTTMGAGNFFRLTTSDKDRARLLVYYVAMLYPSSTAQVYTLIDTPASYSQQLKGSVLQALDELKIKWISKDFSSTSLPEPPKSRVAPIIFCAPSSQTIRVLTEWRRRKVRSQLFTFGSNTNLLVPCAVNGITVADLDRDDTNIIVRKELEHLGLDPEFEGEPSLSTLNAVDLLVNLLLRRRSEIKASDPMAVRQIVLSDLRTSPQVGLIGRYAFDKSGEMIGPEHLSVLKVLRSYKSIRFAHIKGTEKGKPLPLVTWKAALWGVITIIGFIAAIVTIANAL